MLSSLRVLTFTGSDAASFLQGYLTIDTARMTDGQCRLAALTNLKGRVVANGWCWQQSADAVQWVVHETLADRVLAFLRPYLAFARTEATLLTDDHLLIGLLPADAPPTVRLVTSEDALDSLLEGVAVADEAQWVAGCIQSGIALVSAATSETFLPQMLGLVRAGAVDFDKGCYLGQEVVARAEHRGAVKRGLVELTGPAGTLEAGAELTDDTGRPAGTVISAVSGTCLAVVREPVAMRYLADGEQLVPAQSSAFSSGA